MHLPLVRRSDHLGASEPLKLSLPFSVLGTTPLAVLRLHLRLEQRVLDTSDLT
jgi:hypothetical protein